MSCHAPVLDFELYKSSFSRTQSNCFSSSPFKTAFSWLAAPHKASVSEMKTSGALAHWHPAEPMVENSLKPCIQFKVERRGTPREVISLLQANTKKRQFTPVSLDTVPGQNPHTHRKNRQTSHRKVPGIIFSANTARPRFPPLHEIIFFCGPRTIHSYSTCSLTKCQSRPASLGTSFASWRETSPRSTDWSAACRAR